ncbi:hypothetical protein ACH4VM_02825 [Streptomyces sp. NPDC020792]|uniref:hypothetical protein n=1 Tax=Streptomyces sp. NPDC020792 TaxID=3365089 RepID=UPI0037A395F5
MTDLPMPASRGDSPQSPTEARDLRALLTVVLDAITLPHDTPDYEARLVERAAWACTMRAALDEDPRAIGWNVDFLRAKLAAEETKAAERRAERGGAQ